jgi:uncharacterized membrane protein YcaP (DUF421 family)
MQVLVEEANYLLTVRRKLHLLSAFLGRSTDIMDWKSIFVPDTSLLEIILRGSIMYIALFVMLRVILKRQTGTLGMTDLLLITLLADASQNAMAGEYKSIPDGIVLVGTIIFWNYAFDWLSYRSQWFGRLIEPPPLALVKNGRMLRRNMRSELITEDELLMQLREQGLSDLSKVKEAYIESDGRISVIQKKQKRHEKVERKET